MMLFDGFSAIIVKCTVVYCVNPYTKFHAANCPIQIRRSFETSHFSRISRNLGFWLPKIPQRHLGTMFTSKPKKLTDSPKSFSSRPTRPTVNTRPFAPTSSRGSSGEAARRFGYTTGSFRVLVHQFRQIPDVTSSWPRPRSRGRAQSRSTPRWIIDLRSRTFPSMTSAATWPIKGYSQSGRCGAGPQKRRIRSPASSGR